MYYSFQFLLRRFTRHSMVLFVVILCAVVLGNQVLLHEAFAQRKASGVFDNQLNTQSNAEFFTSNYGIWGLDINNIRSGCYWPRGSNAVYIFGAGIWFGCHKRVNGKTTTLVETAYNPNTGGSVFVPGSVTDGLDRQMNEESIKKYRVYISTDFDETGQPIDETDGPAWPLWNTDQVATGLGIGSTGNYIYDTEQRTSTALNAAPVFLSDEDIVCIYKDTDLDFHPGGAAQASDAGYPIGLQVEHAVYTWNKSFLKDVVIMRFDVRNISSDTLYDCWIGPAMDPDLSTRAQSRNAANNDNQRNYIEDPSLGLSVLWTDIGTMEHDLNPGYFGVCFLETPAVDEQKWLRRDKEHYEPSEQLGLVTSRGWVVEVDPNTPKERYDFMSSATIDPTVLKRELRLLLASGPFHLLPGEETRLVIALLFAQPALREEPDGSTEDVSNLVDLVRKARGFYENGAITGIEAKGENSENLQVHALALAGTSEVQFVVRTAQPGELHIDVVNSLGQRIGSPIERTLDAGESITSQVFGSLPSGAYFYRCSLGTERVQGTFTVVR